MISIVKVSVLCLCFSFLSCSSLFSKHNKVNENETKRRPSSTSGLEVIGELHDQNFGRSVVYRIIDQYQDQYSAGKVVCYFYKFSPSDGNLRCLKL